MLPHDRPSDEDFDRLIDRARRSDDAATWETLFSVCYPHVLLAARRRLVPRLRSAYDPDDFASDVMMDMVRDLDRFDFRSLDELIAFLQSMAEHKVRAEARRHDR